MSENGDARMARASVLAFEAERLWLAGEAVTAFETLFLALRLAPDALHLHILFFRRLSQCPAEQVEPLAGLWAEVFRTGLGITVCQDVLVELFAEDPERYELFLGLAVFEVRRKRPEAAEALFFHCQNPVDSGAVWTTESVLGKYQAGAESYDAALFHEETAAEFIAAVDRRLTGRTGLAIIDVACGTGALAEGLRPYAANLTGIDLSPDMAHQAVARYDRFMVGDMVERLTAIVCEADAVVCCGAVYYLDDVTPFLRAAAAALRPGGMLIFSDFAAPEGGGTRVTCGGTRRFCHAPDQVRAAAGLAGLAEIGVDFGTSYALPVRFWSFRLTPSAAS